MKVVFLGVVALMLVPDRSLPAAEPVTSPVAIEMSLESDKPFLAGQKCPITVNLLTATTFSSAVAFDLPRVAGGVLMQFGDRPTLGTRDEGKTSYIVQTYDLAFFALRPGTYTLPSFAVRFSSPAMPGGQPVERSLMTEPLTITAKAPPGAETLPGIVCAEKYRVEESWTPDNPKTLHVGDSLTRRITSNATDVPAMVFPPIPAPSTETLKAYPRPPAVEDRIERGVLLGKRIDETTYICQKPGRVSLPELVIPWWSLEDNVLQEVRLPAVTFEILARPGDAADGKSPGPTAASARRLRWPWWMAAGSALLLSAAIILFVRWEHSASAAPLGAARFHELILACRKNDPRKAHDALFRWKSFSSGNAVTTCEEIAAQDHSLTGPMGDLERAVATGAPWDGRSLADALQRHRTGEGHQARTAAARLPPLNP